MSLYKEYYSKIKHETNTFSSENFLFFGVWICNALYLKSQKSINIYKNERKDIENILQYLWNIVNGNKINDSLNQEYKKNIEKIDLDTLDTTNEAEKALFELICNLQLILDKTQRKSWLFYVSQSIINVLDIILDNEDFNILKDGGFKHPKVQKIITLQFEVLEWLKTTDKVTSKDKEKFLITYANQGLK